MKSNKKVSEVKKSEGIVNLILVGAIFVTIYFSQGFQDPFNSAKMWILIILASICLGQICVKYFYNKNLKVFKSFIIFVSLVIFSFLISAILSANKLVAFIGNTQRRNGFLTYASLLIIFLAFALFSNYSELKKLYPTVLTLSFGLNVYQLFQWQGKDFAKWDNPNNSIIGTMGNPNFSSALMGLMSSYLIIKLIDREINLFIRALMLVNILCQYFLIQQSGSLQGLIASFSGVLVAMNILLKSKRKLFRISYLTFFAFIFVLSILGMLQRGPLQSFLYKPSVSIRGFYWRTAWAIFKDNPIFGVGLDNFGGYFQQYREVGFVLRAGFTITTTDAHNVFLNLLSTGGLIVFLPYLILIVVISYFALSINQDFVKNELCAVSAGWFAFLAQSVISINTSGISIWGWIFGGAIVAIYFSNNRKLESQTIQKPILKSFVIAPLISGALALSSLLIIIPLMNVEKNTLQSRFAFNPKDQQSTSYMKSKGDLVVNSSWADSTYLNIIAVNYMSSGLANDGIQVFNKVIERDNRNTDTLNNLALAYESLDRTAEAIPYRLKLLKINPWGAPNIYQLALDYKKIGNLEQMNALKNKILSFAESTEIGTLAKNNLI